MSESTRMQVAVSVATVWTSPESPRSIDEPALKNPVNMNGWLNNMSVDDKLDLCHSNRIQTQLLMGTEVIVTETKGNWVQICIPDQQTHKNALGYPGWVPKHQLAQRTDRAASSKWAEVTSNRAILSLETAELELSYMTRLPAGEVFAESISVQSPIGEGMLSRRDVRILSDTEADSLSSHKGQCIVKQAERFIGLPYLWGGMSSYGFDCSGFAHQMHKSLGILIPRDASDQARQGVPISREQLEPGDLLFFAQDEGKGRIHHVAIYAGHNHMIHSPDSRGGVEKVRLDQYKLAHEHCHSTRYWV